ncbi:MAG: 50S ribosomal protein L18 [Deltaproteobacteria bacterium]|nr:50S ribosomal protein L18 [Deltaproteobacteria bacterium]
MAHINKTLRQKRKTRIRKKISGTADRPRLSVFKSNRYLYAQVIDDLAQKTLVSASTLKEGTGSNKAAATKLGAVVAEKALAQKIESVIFDRSGYRYHGVIKEIADSARNAGLKF